MAKNSLYRVLAAVAAAALAASLLVLVRGVEPAGADSTACTPPPSGMVSWWPGDGTANDIKGTNDGTLQNGATFAPGKVGQAFSFDGVNDAFVAPLLVSYSTGSSFDAWVKTSDDRGIIMSGGGGGSLERGMGIFIEPGGILSLFGTRNIDSQLNFLIQAGTISDGTFHHVAATWTGDTTPNGVKLYIDGVQVGTATAATSIGTDSVPLHIGGHTTIGHHKLAGVVDEVEVFSRVLSASEIQAIYNAGSAGKCKPGTDTTAPTLNLPSDITEEATGPGGTVVNFDAMATDEDPASPEVSCSPTSGTTFPIGITKVNCSAEDAAGNEATGSIDVTVQDTTPPQISGMPSDITEIATSTSGAQVSYPSPTATDLVDGAVSVNCAPASDSTFALGETTVSCTASDSRTNTATKTFKVKVLYDFAGFFSPVNNLPTINVAKAGSAIPVKFSLGGEMGLEIFAEGYPKSQQIACDSTAPVDGIEETVNANASGLSYDASLDEYDYIWKSAKAWEGSCRQLVVKFKDGTFQRANFKFR